MTAFNNIKTNNWPATSNDLEDFLVLKLPLNDQAALTTSRAIVAGSKVLYPKRTLTNTSVSSLSTQGRLWSSTLDTTNTNDLPFRANDIQAAFGPTSAQVETATNGVGRIIWLDFAGNGGAITGSTLKVLGAGASTSLRDIYLNNASTKSGQLDDLINITGTIINSIQIKSNASNAGALLAGIELDGVRLVNPPGGAKKHYDDNASFNGSASLLLADSGILLGGDYCIETWFRATGSIAAHSRVFECQPANLAFYIYDGPPRTYVQVGGSSSLSGGNNSFSLDTWHHFATTRQGSVTRLFIDGLQKASGSSTASFDIGTTINLNGNASGSYRWNGAMQDFRIYNGAAKYTANFTPPPAILG